MRGNALSIYDVFNSVLNDDFFAPIFRDYTAPRQVRELQAGGFPYTDIYLSDKKDYILEIAVAGVPKDKIDLEFQNRTISLKIDLEDHEAETKDANDASEPKAKTPERHYLQKGIKDFTFVENSWAIDKRWDIEKATAEVKDGILKIVVPLNEKEERLLEKRKIKLLTD
jgi:HSP20 family molecular chaperone IbpA